MKILAAFILGAAAMKLIPIILDKIIEHLDNRT